MKVAKFKIALVGGGNIGSTLAHMALTSLNADITMIDIQENAVRGKSLDLSQALCGLDGTSCTSSISASCNLSTIKESDVVVITAGMTRKPGMSRDDLFEANAKTIQEISRPLLDLCPQAFVIVVTNPLDVMTWVCQEVSKLPKNKVVGMAGVLDTTRFRFFLGQELGISTNNIQSLVLGGHGDDMVPLLSYTTISGIPLMEWIHLRHADPFMIERVIERTRYGGAEIVELLGSSAFYAPATSILEMIRSYLYNEKRVMPISTYVEGAYGVNHLCVGVPAIIGSLGVEGVIELSLSPDENTAFKRSTDNVRGLVEQSRKFL